MSTPLHKHSFRGFTLIEVMIALALGALVLLGLSVLFSVTSGNQNELERSLRKLESARFALDTIGEDVMHAGYYSDFNQDLLDPTPSYQLPDPCAIAVTAQGWNTGVEPIQLPVPIQGIATDVAPGCLTSRQENTEAIVVRHADTSAATALPSSTNNLYIQISRCNDDPKLIIVSPGPASNFTLRQFDCATVNNATRRVFQRTYYVASCNDCAANDGIPTLKRVEMIDGTLRTISIAEGVENLQVEYGIDNDGDGQPESFVTIKSVTDWSNVVSVRLHLLTRATEKTPGYADARTYKLGPDVSVAPPTDGFKRTLMTTTVRINNVGGRRDK